MREGKREREGKRKRDRKREREIEMGEGRHTYATENVWVSEEDLVE